MGDPTGRLCNDATSTLQAAITLNHGALLILLYGELYRPVILPSHLLPEYS